MEDILAELKRVLYLLDDLAPDLDGTEEESLADARIRLHEVIETMEVHL